MNLAGLIFGGGGGNGASGAQAREAANKAPSYSFDRLQVLYDRLKKFRESDLEKSSEAIVETVRQITEAVIWGEQNDTTFFYFFCENRILQDFIRVLGHQKAPKMVKVQLLQTLSMLVQNLRRSESVFYVLTHVNKLIEMKLDFNDEEILAYYITFLKSLAMRLDNETVNFFYIESKNSFPLYTAATKFFGNRDQMVRANVRTITLQVFRIENPRVQDFILRHAAESYSGQLVQHVQELWHRLDAAASSSTEDLSAVRRENELQQDLLIYLSDIFELGVEKLNELLANRLLSSVMFPLLLGGVAFHGRLNVQREGTTLSPMVALFLLRQVFDTFRSSLMLKPLAMALLQPNIPEGLVQTLPPLPGGEKPKRMFESSVLKQESPTLLANPLRPHFLRCLRSRDDTVFLMAVAVVHSCFCPKVPDLWPTLELTKPSPPSDYSSSGNLSSKRKIWPRMRGRSQSRKSGDQSSGLGEQGGDASEPQEILPYILESVEYHLSWSLATLQVLGRIVLEIFSLDGVIKRQWCAEAAAAALKSGLQADAQALIQALETPDDTSEHDRLLEILFEEWNPVRNPMTHDVGSTCSDSQRLLPRMNRTMPQGQENETSRKAASSYMLWQRVLLELQKQFPSGPYAQLAKSLKEQSLLLDGKSSKSPLKLQEEQTEDLKEGGSVDSTQADQRVICSIFAGGATQTRFFIKKDLWLLLVKPDLARSASGSFIITTVWPVRLVQSLVDRSDPRTVSVAMQVPRGATKPGEATPMQQPGAAGQVQPGGSDGGSEYCTLFLNFQDVEKSHAAVAHLQKCQQGVRKQLVSQALAYLKRLG